MNTKALDQRWFYRFEKTAAFQAYEYLNGDLEQRDNQKRLFIEGSIRNPQLDYPFIIQADLDQKELELYALLSDIDKYETVDVVKNAYVWRIDEKLNELKMLKAIVAQDMKAFTGYSIAVYGEPSKEIFAALIGHLNEEINSYLLSDNHSLKQAAADLHNILPTLESDLGPEYKPLADSVSFAHQKTHQEFSGLVDIPKEGLEFDAEKIKQIFEQGLTALQIGNWQVVVETDHSLGISVNHEYRQVKIPQKRTLTHDEIEGLLIHEIGTHVNRRHKGHQTKLLLLSLGLDRYEGAEEGIATMREQAITEEASVGEIAESNRIDRHLAISLTLGLDGIKRDFRDIYEFVMKYYVCKFIGSGNTSKKARKMAQDEAWNTCMRTFRGTDCSTPGASFTKDLIYLEGNRKVWDSLGKNKTEIKRFSSGKYDPTNSRHIKILDELGIA